jgi:hypothetical protein
MNKKRYGVRAFFSLHGAKIKNINIQILTSFEILVEFPYIYPITNLALFPFYPTLSYAKKKHSKEI